MEDKVLYYGNYRNLQQVLNSQHPKSFEVPNAPAHDGMLFFQQDKLQDLPVQLTHKLTCKLSS